MLRQNSGCPGSHKTHQAETKQERGKGHQAKANGVKLNETPRYPTETDCRGAQLEGTDEKKTGRRDENKFKSMQSGVGGRWVGGHGTKQTAMKTAG